MHLQTIGRAGCLYIRLKCSEKCLSNHTLKLHISLTRLLALACVLPTTVHTIVEIMRVNRTSISLHKPFSENVARVFLNFMIAQV